MTPRYSLENDYWIKDNEKNKHLSLNDAVKELNEQNKKLTLIKNKLDDFNKIWGNHPRDYGGGINKVYILMKLMLNTLKEIRKVVDEE